VTDSIPDGLLRSQVPGSDFRALNREAIKAGQHTSTAQVCSLFSPPPGDPLPPLPPRSAFPGLNDSLRCPQGNFRKENRTKPEYRLKQGSVSPTPEAA
jgi:rubredoxin